MAGKRRKAIRNKYCKYNEISEFRETAENVGKGGRASGTKRNDTPYSPVSAETAEGTSPAAGNSGTITVSDVGKSSLYLEWEHGSDGRTPTYDLEYKGVYSTSDNISTVSDAEANGSVIFDWTPDVESINVTGLSEGTEYFFNILVRNADSNTTAYVAVTMKKHFISPILMIEIYTRIPTPFWSWMMT